MKISDMINSAIQKETCEKCGKPKNGILKAKSKNFKSKGFRGNSHFECSDGYQNKKEADLCCCKGE